MDGYAPRSGHPGARSVAGPRRPPPPSNFLSGTCNFHCPISLFGLHLSPSPITHPQSPLTPLLPPYNPVPPRPRIRVRHGCAAQSSVLTDPRYCHSSSRAGTSSAHRLNVDDSRRSPLTSPRGSSSVIHRRCRHVFPEHNDANPTPLTARPPWLAVPPRHRHQAIRFSASPRPAHIRHGCGPRATSSFAERPAAPRSAPSSTSGSAPSLPRTGQPVHSASHVLRPSRSSSTRPASIRPCLTPACSGLARLRRLATDA